MKSIAGQGIPFTADSAKIRETHRTKNAVAASISLPKVSIAPSATLSAASLPNEPILAAQPQPKETTCAPRRTNPLAPHHPPSPCVLAGDILCLAHLHRSCTTRVYALGPGSPSFTVRSFLGVNPTNPANPSHRTRHHSHRSDRKTAGRSDSAILSVYDTGPRRPASSSSPCHPATGRVLISLQSESERTPAAKTAGFFIVAGTSR